jgi:hypothetical protein
MDKLTKRQIFFGIPFMTLFMGGMYLAFEKTEMGDAPIPTSAYWISFLKGLAFAIFILFVGPALVKLIFKRKDKPKQQV